MRFAIWSVYLAICDFAFFKYCFYCKSSLLKGVSYSLFLVFRENEIFIFVIRDRLFFPFVNRATDPLYDPHKYSPQRCEQIWIQAYLVKDKELSLIA